jgi:hypothetical protein
LMVNRLRGQCVAGSFSFPQVVASRYRNPGLFSGKNGGFSA